MVVSPLTSPALSRHPAGDAGAPDAVSGSRCLRSIARTHHRPREPGPAAPGGPPHADRPELARPELALQVGALAEANARLDARAQALAERARRLEAMLEALDQGVCVYDEAQRLVASNPSFARQAACPPELLADGARLVDLLRGMARAGGFGPGAPDALSEARLERLATTSQPTRERQVRPDGRIVDLSYLPIPDGGWVLTMTDVTERERFARELQRANRELERFASVAAHDLQAPLRTVIGACERLRDACQARPEADSGRLVDHALDGARRMQGLIADLLAYARAGFGDVAFAPVAADRPLDVALCNLRAPLLETGARIERQPLPTVRADRGQLMQLFQNLIGNALDYRSTPPPLIRISAARDGGLWRFACADNGIGIEPQHAERIFQPFMRLHTQAEHPGTGIGLAICRRIVERHGGRIWLDLDYTGGSRFCFTLPGVADA